MGTSLLTNQSAMTALQTLRQVGNNMDTTQQRVSTGLRINEAADNTAYWSISSMMKSDRSALNAVSDAMALGSKQIDVASIATDKSKDYLDAIQKSLTTAYEKGEGDVQKLQKDIKANLKNIESAVQSSSLAEKNILANDGQNVRIAGSYRREGEAVYVDMIDVGSDSLNFATTNPDGSIDLSKGQLKAAFGESGVDLQTELATLAPLKQAIADAPDDAAREVAQTAYDEAKTTFANTLKTAGFSVNDFVNADLSSVDADILEVMLKHVQEQTTSTTANVVTAGAELGAAKAQVNGQIDFVGKLVDAVDKGVGALIDADMNAESARLASLQVQQQLGIQALSIANQNSQNILSLFRG